jgi:D-3-phosphoglycerate dehydrogenase
LKILVHDPFIAPERIAQAGAEPASFERVLAESDFVSVHIPLKPDTHHLIGARALRSMKPQAVLINTARGPVVDEAALIRALSEGWIGAAGLDVCEEEPIAKDNPLLKLDNVVMTPHIAGYSDIFTIASGVIRWKRC